MSDAARIAVGLSELATVYGKPENADLPTPIVIVMVYDKAALVRMIRAIGGKFTKRANEYSLVLESERAPGVQIDIPRDKVCKKIVWWDCEPMLSPNDEAEVDAELFAENVEPHQAEAV